MKKLVSLSLLLLVAMISFSCSKSNNSPAAPTPTPTTGTISGRITLAVGQAGSVQNTRVAIYASFDDWNRDRVIVSAAADSNGNYTLLNLTPGTYYLDAWKDNNNSASINAGDFFNVWGSGTYPNYTLSPIQVSAGNTTTVNLQLFIL